MKAVDVKLLDLDWVFQDGNGKRLVNLLANTNNETLFNTKQVNTVIDLLWDRYQDEIFRKIFMNYVVYFSSALIYFTFFLKSTDQNFMTIALGLALKILVLINMFIFEFIEWFQLKNSGLADYITDFWNVFDQISFFLNITTMLMHAFDAPIGSQKTIASVAVFVLYVKFFYWLRLFDSTAAFIRMLKEIIIDIVPFLTFLVVCVGMFANSLLILDQGRRLSGIDAPIASEVFGIPVLDFFVRSYLIGLGEFEMDNYSEHNRMLVWIIFILATFITQLLFLNLLIAIMGDTFDRVQEMRVQAGAKEKISMITDFIWVLDL